MEVKSEILESPKQTSPLNGVVKAIHAPFEMVADVLAWANVDPNRVTASKVLITLPALGVHQFHPIAGVGVFIAGSLADVLDGKLARKTGKSSLEGAVLDALTDKVVNAYMYLYIATQLDWKNIPQDQVLVFLMALNACVDVVSQKMRGSLMKQVADSLRVIWDPNSATPGDNSQKANMSGKIKAHLQCYGIISALLSMNQPVFQWLALAFFSSSLVFAAKSIKGRRT
jgi:phosphatidylglycerophosphate synthase